MDDLLKREALLKLICVECLEGRTFRIEDGPDELWYCPHKRTVTTWREKTKDHGFTLFDVSDEEFFSTLSLGKATYRRVQARMN